jgi:hypothetical protein
MAIRDKNGNSPLMDAKSQGHTAVVEFLRSVGMSSTVMSNSAGGQGLTRV